MKKGLKKEDDDDSEGGVVVKSKTGSEIKEKINVKESLKVLRKLKLNWCKEKRVAMETSRWLSENNN